jgi:hypothetical protein
MLKNAMSKKKFQKLQATIASIIQEIEKKERKHNPK